MINPSIVKAIIVNELKWKVSKLPKIILIALSLYCLLYFFMDLEKEDYFLYGVTSVFVSFLLAQSSLLPNLNKNLACNNFSWNYYLTLTKDIKSLLLGTYLAGFILKIPLIISSVYMFYSSDWFHGDLSLTLVIVCSTAVIIDSYKLKHGISLSKKIETSLTVVKLQDFLLGLSVSIFGVFNFVISLAVGTIIFSSIYEKSNTLGVLLALLILIIANIYFYKSVNFVIYNDPSDKKAIKGYLKVFLALLVVSIISAIVGVVFKV